MLFTTFTCSRKQQDSDGTVKKRLVWQLLKILLNDIWLAINQRSGDAFGSGMYEVCPGPAVVSLCQFMVGEMKGKAIASALAGWTIFAVPTVAGMRLARTIE